jgi:tetratricopeptide (TPR) repeat protein
MTRVTRHKLGGALLLLAIFPAIAGAQFDPLVGARAQALGGAYVSIADDAHALYWNPGALGGRDQQEINSTFGKMYSTELSDNNLVYQLPFALHHGIGLGWRSGGLDDAELNFGSNHLDDGTVSEWDGWGANVGLHYKRPKGIWAVGLVLRNLGNFDVTHEGGVSEQLASSSDSWVLGGSVRPVEGLLFAADVDDRFHLGAEYSYRNIVAVQGGFKRQIRDIYGESGDGSTWSLGLSARWKGLKLDVARVMPPVLPATNRVSLGLEFTLSPSKIAIGQTNVDNIYASQANRYADNPVGTTKLVSKHDEPISARLGLYVPDYMEAPTEKEIVLRPKETKEIDLNAVFSPEILALQEDRPARAEVLVSYQTKNRRRTERARTQLFVYKPGAISWADLGSAAAFVTAQDPTVSGFARQVARGTDVAGQGANLRNIYSAIWVFEALGAYGITYVPDPNNPFASMRDDRDAVDQVQYPRQLLTSRTGDCDDTSVLYCSMLENLGIPTAFLDGPGHILMLFDTGLHARNRQVLAVSEDLYVVRGDRVWIPVETTLLGQPFTEAWLEGASIWARWEDNPDSRLVEVQQAWLEYQPLLPPGAAPAIAPPANDQVGTLVQANIDTLRIWQRSYLEEKFLKPLEQSSNVEQMLESGILYAQEGRLAEARGQFEVVLAENPEDAAALNDLGNVELFDNRPDEALNLYRRARDIDPDPGIYLNEGLLLWSQGDDEAADAAFQTAIDDLDGDVDRALGMLGLHAPETSAEGERSRAPRLTTEEIRQRLLLSSHTRTAADSMATEPPRRDSPGGPVVSKVSGSRAVDMQSLARIVYWKEQ